MHMCLLLTGVCYYDGTGIPKDQAEAARYYKLAADQGYEDAQFNLGKGLELSSSYFSRFIIVLFTCLQSFFL